MNWMRPSEISATLFHHPKTEFKDMRTNMAYNTHVNSSKKNKIGKYAIIRVLAMQNIGNNYWFSGHSQQHNDKKSQLINY